MQPSTQQSHVNAPMGNVSVGYKKQPVELAGDIDLTPPEAVQAAARRGLELRRKWGRGGLSTQEASQHGIGSGVARATTLANGKAVSPKVIGQMVSFFSRHKKNYQPDKKEPDGGPTAGTISWYLWGGNEGMKWARRVYDQLQERKVTKANHSKSHCMLCKSSPPQIDVLWNGGKSRAWFCDECYPEWSQGRDIVMSNRVDGGQVTKRFKQMRHSPIEKAIYTGAIICLYVSDDVAKKLALPDGLSPDELHITLAYLGEAKDLKNTDKLISTLKQFADKQSPLKGKIGGLGVFQPDEGVRPFFVTPDVPGLTELRTKLVSLNGLKQKSEHGFNAHITLKYIGEREKLPFVNIPEYPLTFDRLTLMLAGKRQDFELKGKKPMNKDTVLKINGQPVTLKEMAKAWLDKGSRSVSRTSNRSRSVHKATFTDVPWSDPAANLSPEDYAKVCLINLSPDEPKKATCKLPVKATPDGPYNRNALRAAGAALMGARGGLNAPTEAKRAAAKRLVGLMEQAEIEVGDGLKRLAGVTEKSDKDFVVPIVKADEERRVVYGVVLRPDLPDSQGDKISKEEIEKAAWNFMQNYGLDKGRIDYQHKEVLPLTKAYPVESYCAPVEMQLGSEVIPAGSWVMAVHVPDNTLWRLVKAGDINGFSIRGWGKRQAG